MVKEVPVFGLATLAVVGMLAADEEAVGAGQDGTIPDGDPRS